MKLVKWLVYGLIGFCILAVCSFCGFFVWVGRLEEEVFRQSLPVFSDAREVSNAHGYYGANTGLVTLYFWTTKPLQDVKAYYETFTPTFVYSKYPFDWAAHDYYRTAFNPSGKLPIMTAEFGGETINPLQDKNCYYRMKYACVEIELIDFQGNQPVVLRPVDGPMRRVATPSPIGSDIRGGTLIVYMYYVGAM